MASWERQPHMLGPTPPRNVEQITKASQEYEYNAQVPLRNWLRTAAALLKEAEIYMREGDEETTYLLLYRHSHLILAHLQAHPEAKSSTVLPQVTKDVSKNLKTLDILRPRINQRYERYDSILRDRKARQDAQKATQDVSDSRGQSPALAQTVHQLHGHENSKLAVELAHRERHRRAGIRQDATDVSKAQPDISTQVQTIQMLAAKSHAADRPSTASSILHPPAYHYPSVKGQLYKSQDLRGIDALWAEPRPQQSLHEVYRPPPAPPPKRPELGNMTQPPPIPEKVSTATESRATSSEPAYTFTPTATLENGTSLRTLFLPPTLRTTFLRLAHKNTVANLETCAFLAGTLISNGLFVSKLIVPSQVATSDTCEMTNESQLFDYVDNEKDLMVLGWIHTHPSQTCFMSSRDLHTHAGYQMMLAESIAIVCAPSKGDTTHGGDWGAYRLTDPPGKMAILNCARPGIFHPHDVDNIYTDALRPGHVVEASGLEFEVVDLRDT